MVELPKYVIKDLSILQNAECKTDKYGNYFSDHCKMAEKLFSIGFNYPQKNLEAILEYLGYFDGTVELNTEDFRKEIFHNAEYCFMEAMKSDVMYEKPQKQVKFIELGVIGGWFASPKAFRDGYKEQYPSQIRV